MEITELTIKIIILLLPGIFGTFLLEKLYYKEKLELRTFIISVIIIGFSSYFLLYIINNIIGIIINGLKNHKAENIHFFKVLIGKEENIILREVFYSTLIGILIGITSANIINKGIFYKIFRDVFHITNSTGQDVWGEIFDNNTKGSNSFAYVVDVQTERVYGGWVQNYSNNSKEPEILLKDVEVRDNNNRKKLLYKISKLYLKLPKERIIIELIEKGEEVMNKIENSKLTNEREYYGSELNKTTKIESSIYIGTAIETEESNENNNQQFIKNSLNPNNQPSETPSAPGSK